MISILCPSRGRPELAKKMIGSALATGGGELQIILYLNNDDPELARYRELIDSKFFIVGPDRSPAYSWNKLAGMARYDILCLMGDDAWFETANWVPKVMTAFNNYNDKIVFAYPDMAGYQGILQEHHCPHYFLHKNWIRVLGYFVPPQFWHWYVDTWHHDIAKLIGRRHIIKDVKIPLLIDYADTTKSREDRLSNRERDHWLWQNTQRWLHADAQALLNFINMHKNKGQ